MVESEHAGIVKIKKSKNLFLSWNMSMYNPTERKYFTWPPHRYGWGVGEATVEAKKGGGVAPAP